MSGDGHLNIESSVDGGTATVKLIGAAEVIRASMNAGADA